VQGRVARVPAQGCAKRGATRPRAGARGQRGVASSGRRQGDVGGRAWRVGDRAVSPRGRGDSAGTRRDPGYRGARRDAGCTGTRTQVRTQRQASPGPPPPEPSPTRPRSVQPNRREERSCSLPLPPPRRAHAAAWRGAAARLARGPTHAGARADSAVQAQSAQCRGAGSQARLALSPQYVCARACVRKPPKCVRAVTRGSPGAGTRARGTQSAADARLCTWPAAGRRGRSGAGR
jgi:hypothetical protein